MLGLQLHIGGQHGGMEVSAPSPLTKEVDFFKDHEAALLSDEPAPSAMTLAKTTTSPPMTVKNGKTDALTTGNIRRGAAARGSGMWIDSQGFCRRVNGLKRLPKNNFFFFAIFFFFF